MPVIKCFNKECHYWDDNDDPDNCSHPTVEIQKCSHGMIRKDSPVKSKNFYYEQLMSNECFCGESKQKRNSFCVGCYHKLPDEMKADLWKWIGKGYEEAYEAAVKFLEG